MTGFIVSDKNYSDGTLKGLPSLNRCREVLCQNDFECYTGFCNNGTCKECNKMNSEDYKESKKNLCPN